MGLGVYHEVKLGTEILGKELRDKAIKGMWSGVWVHAHSDHFIIVLC